MKHKPRRQSGIVLLTLFIILKTPLMFQCTPLGWFICRRLNTNKCGSALPGANDKVLFFGHTRRGARTIMHISCCTIMLRIYSEVWKLDTCSQCFICTQHAKIFIPRNVLCIVDNFRTVLIQEQCQKCVHYFDDSKMHFRTC